MLSNIQALLSFLDYKMKAVMLVLIFLLFSGCAAIWSKLLEVNISRSDWEIQKIVVYGKEYSVFVVPNATDMHKIVANKQEFSKQGNLLSQNLEKNSTMIFDRFHNHISGVAGCNHYTMGYLWKDRHHFQVDQINVTRKFCTTDNLMNFEFALIKNFKGLFLVKKEKA